MNPKLIAFFKGTAGDYLKMRDFAPIVIGAAAVMRNHVSPLVTSHCTACAGTGYVIVPNGADDIEKEVCANCEGSGRVVANH